MFMTPARWLRSVAVAGGMVTAIFLSPAGPASADPISEALVTTACSYPQITAALNAQAPDLAAQLNMRPQMQTNLQAFLAMPTDQRQQQIAQQQAANPQMQALMRSVIGAKGEQEIIQVANTCMNY
jgi:hemophore-related protein